MNNDKSALDTFLNFANDMALSRLSPDEMVDFLNRKEQAAAEYADYELRLDLLTKGATWEHNENADLREQLATLRAEIKSLRAELKELQDVRAE
jgi:chromosome segregation ATPase